MESEMEEMWKRFRLSEKEGGKMLIKSKEVTYSQKQAQFSLLVKLQINKDYNKEAFKATLRQLWRCSHGVSINDVGNNLYLAIFEEESNLEEIITKSPWSFDKYLFLLKHFHGDMSPCDVKFKHASF